jgi:hypothetical protein
VLMVWYVAMTRPSITCEALRCKALGRKQSPLIWTCKVSSQRCALAGVARRLQARNHIYQDTAASHTRARPTYVLIVGPEFG